MIFKINGEDVFDSVEENTRKAGDSFCFNYVGEEDETHIYHIPFNDLLIQTDQEVYIEINNEKYLLKFSETH